MRCSRSETPFCPGEPTGRPDVTPSLPTGRSSFAHGARLPVLRRLDGAALPRIAPGPALRRACVHATAADARCAPLLPSSPGLPRPPLELRSESGGRRDPRSTQGDTRIMTTHETLEPHGRGGGRGK
jgi:hypothetical protein